MIADMIKPSSMKFILKKINHRSRRENILLTRPEDLKEQENRKH